jgi:hypothetical protein
MQHLRPTPFDLVFESLAPTIFPAIQAALASKDRDPRDRDAFLMLGEVVRLLHDLRPDEGLGEGIDQLAALVHHGYLFWEAGGRTVELNPERLENLLGSPPGSSGAAMDLAAFYTQLPERRVWAQVVPGEPHEPLDGYFQYAAIEPGELRVLGVFGVHPERAGFSVVEVAGQRPLALARSNGAPLYAPILPGGAAAGLHSLAGEEELLDLAWRTRASLPGAEAAGWRA